MFKSPVRATVKQFTTLSTFKKFLIAFILVVGFYAWIIVGYGLVGKLERINIVFAGRASDFSLETSR